MAFRRGYIMVITVLVCEMMTFRPLVLPCFSGKALLLDLFKILNNVDVLTKE